MPAAQELLAPESRAALDALGASEVVAGVHALNRASTLASLLDAVEGGVAKLAASRRTTVLVIDTGSRDETADAARAWCDAEAGGPARRLLVPSGPVRRGAAVHALLAAARGLGARGLVVLDADVTGIRADGVAALITPVIENATDYVSPAYSRAISEGTLTTNLLAPLTSALYGQRIQQVTGGCCALAASLIEHCVTNGAGAEAAHAHEIEIALTTAALASGSRVAEAHLGRRVVDPSLPQIDLATTLVRTVGPVFETMEGYRDVWVQSRQTSGVPRFGDVPVTMPDRERPATDRMVHAFNLGMKDLLPVWEQIMPEQTLARLYPLALREP